VIVVDLGVLVIVVGALVALVGLVTHLTRPTAEGGIFQVWSLRVQAKNAGVLLTGLGLLTMVVGFYTLAPFVKQATQPPTETPGSTVAASPTGAEIATPTLDPRVNVTFFDSLADDELSESVDIMVGNLPIGKLSVDGNNACAKIPFALIPGDQAYSLAATVRPRSGTPLAQVPIPAQGGGQILIAGGQLYEVNLDRVSYRWFLNPCSPGAMPCSSCTSR
jgi:hypothetical protein